MSVCRSSFDYEPVPADPEDLKIMRIMDETYLEDPCMGTRCLKILLKREHGVLVNRKRLQRLRRAMGLETIWCRPANTSRPDQRHRKYPYLLRDLEITNPDQVWCADITYVPMPCGNAYLCAVMDWKSRRVLGWRLSNTMDTSLCMGALDDAIEASGGRAPKIFNTDQGCQFTSEEWISRLLGLGVEISMDGKGRWRDNVLIERLWRSVKYEDIYLREYSSIEACWVGLSRWFKRYNTWRPHQALGYRTPDEVYADRAMGAGRHHQSRGQESLA